MNLGVTVEKDENDGFVCFWPILGFFEDLLGRDIRNGATRLLDSGDILNTEFRSFEKKMSVFVSVFCLSAQSGEACFRSSCGKNGAGFV